MFTSFLKLTGMNESCYHISMNKINSIGNVHWSTQLLSRKNRNKQIYNTLQKILSFLNKINKETFEKKICHNWIVLQGHMFNISRN